MNSKPIREVEVGDREEAFAMSDTQVQLLILVSNYPGQQEIR